MTRAIALATDAALTTVILMSITGVVALVASLVGGLRPEWLVGALLGSGWFLLTGAYFSLFWSAAGQTPGMRLLRVCVRGPDGTAPSLGRSLVRFVGLVLAIVPLFAGFVPVLFTERRRGLPDFVAGTVVVFEDSHTAEAARTARRAPGSTTAALHRAPRPRTDPPALVWPRAAHAACNVEARLVAISTARPKCHFADAITRLVGAGRRQPSAGPSAKDGLVSSAPKTAVVVAAVTPGPSLGGGDRGRHTYGWPPASPSRRHQGLGQIRRRPTLPTHAAQRSRAG